MDRVRFASSNLWWCDRVEEWVNLWFHFWNADGNGNLNDIYINVEVGVGKNVAHSDDLFPGNCRCQVTSGLGEAAAGFSDDLEVLNKPGLYEFIVFKAFPPEDDIDRFSPVAFAIIRFGGDNFGLE